MEQVTAKLLQRRQIRAHCAIVGVGRIKLERWSIPTLIFVTSSLFPIFLRTILSSAGIFSSSSGSSVNSPGKGTTVAAVADPETTPAAGAGAAEDCVRPPKPMKPPPPPEAAKSLALRALLEGLEHKYLTLTTCRSILENFSFTFVFPLVLCAWFSFFPPMTEDFCPECRSQAKNAPKSPNFCVCVRCVCIRVWSADDHCSVAAVFARRGATVASKESDEKGGKFKIQGRQACVPSTDSYPILGPDVISIECQLDL